MDSNPRSSSWWARIKSWFRRVPGTSKEPEKWVVILKGKEPATAVFASEESATVWAAAKKKQGFHPTVPMRSRDVASRTDELLTKRLGKKYRRRPTKVQWVMIALMGIAFGSLLLWTIPELIGVASPNAEDTYSEWVWDLPLWATGLIVFGHIVAGILLIWSAGHFLEGWKRRRDKENG